MMVLTEAQIDDMRTSLHRVKQPFTPEAIDSLCDMAKGVLPAARAEVGALRPGLEAVQTYLRGAIETSLKAADVLDNLEAFIANELSSDMNGGKG